MKTLRNMKRVPALLAVFAAMLLSVPVFAGDDRPLTVQELPAAAQQFLRSCFPSDNKEHKIAYATVDDDWFDREYKVVFVDGSKVEFDRKGEWKQVECKYGRVPLSIVPQQIQAALADLYGDYVVVGIERDRREYEVKLSNRLEVTFDRSTFRIIDIDD